MNIKQGFKILETSVVSGLTAGVGVLSTNGAHLTLKTAGAAGVAALLGFLYQVNRQVGVAEGASSPVTTTVADVSKIVTNQLPAVPTPAPVVAPAAEVFPPKDPS